MKLVRDCVQVSLLILSEFKGIDYLVFPQKSLENYRFDYMKYWKSIIGENCSMAQNFQWRLSNKSYAKILSKLLLV